MTTPPDHVETGLEPGNGQPGPWGDSDPAEMPPVETLDHEARQARRDDRAEATPRSVGELVAARRGDRGATEPGDRSPGSEYGDQSHVKPISGGDGPGPGLHERLRAAAITALGEIRWVSERPASLREQIGYSRNGAWTAEIDGRARHLQLLWAWAVAIPVTVAAYLTVWSVSRSPLRALAVWGVVAVLATVLNQIPGVELLVPDSASLTAWPPFSWL